MTNSTKIFISYARKDGRDLALKFKDSLELVGYDVWLDTSEIEGGDSWGKTIEEAIDARDAVLALMSPASYISEICRAEQLRALRKHKRVIPIRVSEKADIPIWLEPLNYRDFSKAGDYDTAFAQVLADLGDTSYKPPVIYDIFNNAPALPPHFIPRPDEFNQLKDALLSDTTDRQVALTALRGLGGIGKSVMANVVCRDEFVSGAFPDGVFWVELGREPQDITGKLAIIGQGLGDEAGNYATLDNAISSLRNILKHQSALIVLDDVWAESLKVAQYFIGASPRTRWLITTRDQKIVESLDATPIELGVMTPVQALALMREWAGRYDVQFPSITEKLGYHPLGLKIVGARLLDMDTDEWVKNYEIARVKLDYDAEGRDENLIACFQVSVDSLSTGLPPLYHALGIFPEDVWIPESMVAVLWRALNPKLSPADCTDISIKLAKLALIDRQRDKKQIRMHDLLHDYNRYKIHNQQSDLQDCFVTALGNPYALPHVYAWRYYAYHLVGANRLAELRPLLLSCRWLDMKLRANDPKALIDDCTVWLNQGKDETIRLIQSAISNSAHVLEKDISALAQQLVGRLMHYYTKIGEVSIFLDEVMKTPNNLFPAFPDSKYDIMNPAGGMLLRTLKHEAGVNGAVQLHDGRILSWSVDKTLRLWQLDGTPVAILKGHKGEVLGATQLRNGRILSWSDDKTLRLWDMDGVLITTLMGHTALVYGAIELRDGRILSWSWDKTLRLWHPDGIQSAILTRLTDWVKDAIELRDGRILSWSVGKTLMLWKSDGKPIANLIGHTALVCGGIELRDGRILSWSWDKTLRLWDSSGTAITILAEHTDYVFGGIELRDGRVLSWSEDKTLRLWQSDGRFIITLIGHESRVNGAIELRDGRILSWGGDDNNRFIKNNDNTLRLWKFDGTPIAVLMGHGSKITGAIELHDGRILSWSNDKILCLWESNGKLIATLTGHTALVCDGIELRDGRVLSWSGDKTLRLWQPDGMPITVFIVHINRVNGIIELRDGRILSWSDDGTLCLWGRDGTPITVLMGHRSRVTGAIELRDGRILSWSDDGTLCLWGRDGTLITNFSGHWYNVTGAIELRDGRILSWGDRTLCLRGRDGTLITDFSSHWYNVTGAIELRDGRILSWGDDEVCLWHPNGALIDIHRQDDEYSENEDYIISVFAEEYELDNELYRKSQRNISIGCWYVEWAEDTVRLFDPQTDETIHTFYGDAPFKCVNVLDGGHMVVAGDSAGRVLFLRWIGEDNTPTTTSQ